LPQAQPSRTAASQRHAVGAEFDLPQAARKPPSISPAS
jgi:hypothetical protein